MRRVVELLAISFVVMLIFTQSVAYCMVLDVYDGGYFFKIKVLESSHLESKAYEFKGKKYDLKSLAEFIKRLSEELDKKSPVVFWKIEIETAESYESIQELAEVLKYYKHSSIKIAPAEQKN